MNKYAEAALRATDNIVKKRMEPLAAWQEAVSYVFPEKEASQKKGCPRGTFLGLCEEGYIIGVKRGNYTNSKLNKQYAIDAVEYIRKNKNYPISPNELWVKIVKNKKHNEQMSVVLALIKSGAITV